MRPQAKAKIDTRVRIHFENLHSMSEAYWITQERYDAAAGRQPSIARHIDASIGWDLEGLEEAVAAADVLVGWRFPLGEFESRAPNVRWIHLIGAGVDHVMPLSWLPDGVILTNNKGVHEPKAAEFATMAILMLNNLMPFYVTNMRAARWEKIFTPLVTNKTLVVFGVGKMGGAAARSAKRLGMRVLGVRRSGKRHRYVDEMVKVEELGKVLPRADVLVVCAPLTSETHGLIGRAQLDQLKPGAGVINMGRGPVVDYDALIDKLRSGELSGAILDVFDTEPLSEDSPLWHAPNVIITPHVSSDDPENYAARSLDLIFENVRRYLAGRPLRNVVDRTLGY